VPRGPKRKKDRSGQRSSRGMKVSFSSMSPSYINFVKMQRIFTSWMENVHLRRWRNSTPQVLHRTPLPLCIDSIFSHASKTRHLVRYSPYYFSFFSFMTRKVSPGKLGPNFL
jgi:hypothetical protein